MRKSDVGRIVFVFGVLVSAQVALGAVDDGIEYYLTDFCNNDINITAEVDGIVISQSGAQYPGNQNCRARLKSANSRRVVVTFVILDVSKNDDDTCDDTIYIYDGDSVAAPLLTSSDGLCGVLLDADSYESSGDTITIQFITGATNFGGGFTIAVTEFHNGTCDDAAEFLCDNGNCISINLKDNLRDNCGDASDEHIAIQTALGLWAQLMEFGLGAAIGIIVAVVVVFIILLVCLGCCIAKCCCKKVSPV